MPSMSSEDNIPPEVTVIIIQCYCIREAQMLSVPYDILLLLIEIAILHQ
jgi:hypothetical protein